jgi:hypothetical protein
MSAAFRSSLIRSREGTDLHDTAIGRRGAPDSMSLPLFRQQMPYHWSGVVERVVAALG